MQRAKVKYKQPATASIRPRISSCRMVPTTVPGAPSLMPPLHPPKHALPLVPNRAHIAPLRPHMTSSKRHRRTPLPMPRVSPLPMAVPHDRRLVIKPVVLVLQSMSIGMPVLHRALRLIITVAPVRAHHLLHCRWRTASPLTNAGGSITDILTVKQRGIGMALFCAAPFLGPALGPISGGFLADAAGWKWVMGFLAILCAFILIVVALFAPETHAPTILRQRAALLSKTTGKTYRYMGDVEKPFKPVEMFREALLLPWQFLLDPVILILSIYIAIIYGTLYLNFAAYPIVFQKGRGWSTGVQGLAFLGIAVGVLLAVAMMIIQVTVMNKKSESDEKPEAPAREPTPEDKLPGAIVGGIACVIGLAGFAATCGPDVHWIASVIFGVPFGFGMVLTFLTIMGYLVDSYPIYAASVLASNSILRSLFGAAFPMFTSNMYEALGIHWAAAVPGFLALACVPAAFLFWKYGAQIRARSKWAAESDRQVKAMAAARAEALAHYDAVNGSKEKETV